MGTPYSSSLLTDYHQEAMKLVSTELGGLWSSESGGWLFVHECYSGWITMSGLEMGEVVTVEWICAECTKGEGGAAYSSLHSLHIVLHRHDRYVS